MQITCARDCRESRKVRSEHTCLYLYKFKRVAYTTAVNLSCTAGIILKSVMVKLTPLTDTHLLLEQPARSLKLTSAVPFRSQQRPATGTSRWIIISNFTHLAVFFVVFLRIQVCIAAVVTSKRIWRSRPHRFRTHVQVGGFAVRTNCSVLFLQLMCPSSGV